MLGALEENGHAGYITRDVEVEGDFAVGVEGAVESTDDFALVDVFYAEGGAVACVVVDVCGAGLGAVDGDGFGAGGSAGDHEQRLFTGD